MNSPLWTPSTERIAHSNITAFRQQLNQQLGLQLTDYAQLYQWSIDQSTQFWTQLWQFAGVIGERGERTLINPEQMPGAQWFPDAQINFAENLLRHNSTDEALVFWGEDQVRRRVSYAELQAQVSRLQQAFKALGVQAGDRVAGYMPNLPETLIAMLAASSLGAIWSSCSPDFGVQGVLDRFGQIQPKVLLCADGYHYNGKQHDCLAKLAQISAQLPSVQQVIVIPYVQHAPSVEHLPNTALLEALLAPYAPAPLEFVRLPFNHPLYIMYSSGTTGAPKCIVHGAGGTLLQHLKEHLLHTDLHPHDRLFYFTTCGWMMWNWLVSGLAAGATLLLFDGSPFYPSGNILFDYAEQERCTVFGTSAKFIDACHKQHLQPIHSHDLSALRAILSTGSPLVPESFDYVYQQIKADVQLSSISGGTDIVSCFALGNPVWPVWRGELQCRGLGMAVQVWDEQGQPLRGEKGELVCTQPFPSMPISFWNDADGAKYRAAYFERFPNVWCHGDYVELTEHDGLVIYGRSDAVLNPGGVRIGTAEIYRQVERLPEVIESLVIGQDWQDDVRVVLFVHLREGLTLDEALTARIKQQIRANTTPRHVPAKVIQVAAIPRTKSGKIVELAVRNVVHQQPVKNKEALANPEALEHFRDLPELQQD